MFVESINDNNSYIDRAYIMCRYYGDVVYVWFYLVFVEVLWGGYGFYFYLIVGYTEV